MIKLLSLEFHSNGIRKLKNLKIDFADRITLIAGYNGIGKSTILGLIASASGLTQTKDRSYFNKPYHLDVNEIIHFDPIELKNEELKTPWPMAVYSYTLKDEQPIELWKNISITKRGEDNRLKSVPRTDSGSPDQTFTGGSAKVPLPTIYLGMVRMLPIGESSEMDVHTTIEEIDEADAVCLKKFVNQVINGSTVKNSQNITEQSIKNTKKSSKHPAYAHTSKSVSLGQDSLSSIATAIASFNKLKRESGDDYKGGLLIIDEIDAGFHPHAQQKLIDALANAARNLSLQIIATTHSPTLIQYVHPDSTIRDNTNRAGDLVHYIADSATPKLSDWSLDEIIADMSLLPWPSDELPPVPDIKAYLEDNEAAIFLKGVLKISKNFKTYYGHNRQKRLQVIPLGVGGNHLINLPKHDSYFSTILLIVDGDTSIPRGVSNAIKLPSGKSESGAGCNPERTIYEYISELAKGDNCCYPTTFKKLFKQGYTTDRLSRDFLSSDVNITDRDSSKKWFKKVEDKLKAGKFFSYWADDHKSEMKSFITQLELKLDALM
jgi:predicted ATPase